MIDFFTFMNTCSPFRTILYLIFIFGMTFMLISGIGTIIELILNRNNETYDGTTEDDSVED